MQLHCHARCGTVIGSVVQSSSSVLASALRIGLMKANAEPLLISTQLADCFRHFCAMLTASCEELFCISSDQIPSGWLDSRIRQMFK